MALTHGSLDRSSFRTNRPAPAAGLLPDFTSTATTGEPPAATDQEHPQDMATLAVAEAEQEQDDEACAGPEGAEQAQAAPAASTPSNVAVAPQDQAAAPVLAAVAVPEEKADDAVHAREATVSEAECIGQPQHNKGAAISEYQVAQHVAEMMGLPWLDMPDAATGAAIVAVLMSVGASNRSPASVPPATLASAGDVKSAAGAGDALQAETQPQVSSSDANSSDEPDEDIVVLRPPFWTQFFDAMLQRAFCDTALAQLDAKQFPTLAGYGLKKVILALPRLGYEPSPHTSQVGTLVGAAAPIKPTSHCPTELCACRIHHGVAVLLRCCFSLQAHALGLALIYDIGMERSIRFSIRWTQLQYPFACSDCLMLYRHCCS